MKKVALIFTSLILLIALAACGGKASDDKPQTDSGTNANAIVVYFSNTGNTRGVAEKIAAATDAQIFEIIPATPYTAADLDGDIEDSRVNTEHNDAAARPEIVGSVDDISDYDVVFIGYPIWIGQAPKVISTFLESTDLSGKTIVPFCTSGSSGIDDSIDALKACAPAANWLEGQRFAAGAEKTDIEAWLGKLNVGISVK